MNAHNAGYDCSCVRWKIPRYLKFVRTYKADCGFNRLLPAVSSSFRRKISQQTPMKEIHISQEVINKRRGRIVIDRLRRSNLFQPAVIQDRYAVGNLQRFFLIVCDKHGGYMQIIVDSAQPVPQFLAHLRIQGAEGFVEEQYLGPDGQCSSQCHALSLPAGELLRIHLR